MSMKKGNFVEQHIDKLILGVIVLVCLGLLWVFVFGNPYGVEVNRQKQSPGSLQTVLNQKKNALRQRLDEGPQGAVELSSKNYVTDYGQLLGCSISKINPNIYPLNPGIGNQPIESGREYAIPEIPALQEVQVSYIRAAAYLPTEEVKPDMPYPSVTTEIGDLDFVTISARLDAKRLYQQFQSCFIGLNVKSSHRDTTLATPVAARVELQRRVQKADGSWSDWGVVPLAQTEAYRKLFEKLPTSSDLTSGGGIQVQMIQYKDALKQAAVLQPLAYDFATSRYQYWMPPEYLKEAQELIQQQRDEERRLKREAAAAGAGAGYGTEETGRGGGRNRPTPPRPNRPEPNRGRDRDRRGGNTETMGEGHGIPGMETGGRPVRPTAPQRTLESIFRDYQKELIMGTDWWTRNDPVLVWAHDDTVQPGKTYEYRIRVGMFNPIAGRDWFRPEFQDYKNQVILWSPFATQEKDKEEAIVVDVPKRLHIFPMDVSKDNPDAVQIKVAKYYMGRWNSASFDVLPGQVIGSVVENKEEPVTAGAGGMETMGMEMPMQGMAGGAAGGTPIAPTNSSIDYTTDYLYVDIMGEVDWSGSVSALRRKEYADMLFTVDGSMIQKLPIKQQNWSSDLKTAYRDVQEAERESEGEALVGRTSVQPSMMQSPGIPTRGMPPMGGFGREGGMGMER